MYHIVDGWIQEARRVDSPNFGPRPQGLQPDLLVIHNISLPPGEYGNNCVEDLFTNCLNWDAHPYFNEIRGLEVSSHLLIRRDGELVQFVSCHERAWHAGDSCFAGRDNCNDYSIGVELEGTDDELYTDEQYEVLQILTRTLLTHYRDMNAQRIAGHSDIAPARKTDPGPAFDWSRFRRAIIETGGDE
ncbi:MAG: 1,6-anhydro-N-acetylmuramyl-L-alanine amidase AmpD [Halioglobus sp.]